MPFNHWNRKDEGRGNDQRDPTALPEFSRNHREKDENRDDQPDAVHQEPVPPVLVILAHLPPVADHARLRQREGDKNVDTV